MDNSTFFFSQTQLKMSILKMKLIIACVMDRLGHSCPRIYVTSVYFWTRESFDTCTYFGFPPTKDNDISFFLFEASQWVIPKPGD